MHQATGRQLPEARDPFVDGMVVFEVLALQVFAALSPGVEPDEDSPAPERSRSPGRVCHSTLLLSSRSVTGAGRAFLPRPGLAVFRHSRVSGKRSQTLNSLGGKHYG